MRPFRHERPATPSEGVRTAHRPGQVPPVQAPAQYIAGGTNLVDTMKLGVAYPEVLVDLNRIGETALRRIEVTEAGIRFGALVRMAEAEEHETVKRRYPVIAESLALAASPQIRNVASLAGNLLQRTRCEYFRETTWRCNKREPGAGCSAIGGFDRQHAILGTSEHCIATYPGDLAQALIALDAMVEIEGGHGLRKIPLADLHRLPGDTPHIETILHPDDLITAITVPAGPWTQRSHFLKVRDRTSYSFALASAAVALHLDGGVVGDVRIALGGVATVPWRARAAEDALRGKPLDERTATTAAEAAFAVCDVGRHNAFKLPLGKATVVQALLETQRMPV